MADPEHAAEHDDSSNGKREGEEADEPNGPTTMDVQERFELVRSVGDECVQEDELMNLLKNKDDVICYDGFEPSGRMHIAQGVLKALHVNKLTSAGCFFKFWVADWFAMMNNKMGGDLRKIQTVGNYFVEVRYPFNSCFPK